MKQFFIILLLMAGAIAKAQWKDTANNFYDSLHTPVCTAIGQQTNPIVLTSYPDGGYFVIWEDQRNFSVSKTDIYAQKFDKNGNRLWAVDGVPVANGNNNQHYTYGSNQDYRNRSFAATDSAGGFYITFMDDSTGTLNFNRVIVQHVRSNGSNVFGGLGYIITAAGSTFYDYMWPQLIADGNKGFYIAYKQTYYENIHAYCYRDENGSMKYYGGGRMNENAYQYNSIAPCGIKSEIYYRTASPYDYNIWPDGEGGCNIVMQLYGNNGQGTVGAILGYNRLWRAKKDSKVKTYFRNTSGAACPRTTEYKKGDVYMLYYIVSDFQSVFCNSQNVAYAYTNFRLLSNGYLVVDQGNAYDHNFPKGVTLRTDSNINVNLIAACRRKYENNILSDFTIQGYAHLAEKFDSVPYQRASHSNPDIGYNPVIPFGVKKLNNFRDTLLAVSSYYTDFSIASSGSEIYISGLMGNSGSRQVRLQKLEASRKTADSFAVEYKTNIAGTPEKTGVAIGAELSTGFGGSSISYDHPLLAAKKGNFMFYIREYYRAARVSPIGSGAALEWGAMGTAVGTGLHNTYAYNYEQPVLALDSAGSSGIIAWRDNRMIPGSPTAYDNIYVRHINKMNTFNYQPPVKEIRTLNTASNFFYANPAVLYGSSGKMSMLDGRTYDYATTPLIALQDNHYLGAIDLRTYQHVGQARRFNNEAFLHRNFTITPDSLPTGNRQYSMYLYFTKAEFEALKNTELVIQNPGFLSVIRQPSTAPNVPAAYTPISGEETITPLAWDSVKGGYYLFIISNGLGNFFIKKLTTSTLCRGSSTGFASNLSGSAYQWQVNTGGAVFTDIGNSGNYSGTATPSLTVSNIPSSFNGYRYRCRVDGTRLSNTYLLQVANSFTGVVNNTWETPGNWSCNMVPDANTDVFVNSGTVTVNSSANCRSLKVAPGASVAVAPGFSLTVTH